MATAQQLYDEVRASLGGTLVDVELTDVDIEISYQKARRRYIQRGSNNYRKAFYPIHVYRNQRTYDIHPDINTIVKIVKPSQGWTLEDPLSHVAYNELFEGRSTVHGGLDFLSYEMTLHLLEQQRRFMSYDVQFFHRKFDNQIELLNPPERNTLWFIECYANLSDDRYRELDWIIRWTIAESKQMLGMAYRKFSSLAAPHGEVQLDGASLIQEGKQEQEELLMEIENMVDGDVDYVEIRFG
jgi:hypothetical protein